jgi:hypothetical protein
MLAFLDLAPVRPLPSFRPFNASARNTESQVCILPGGSIFFDTSISRFQSKSLDFIGADEIEDIQKQQRWLK